MMLCSDNEVILTCSYAFNGISNNSEMVSSFISPSNHEEADTRVFLQVNDMSLQGHKKIIMGTVDTNVLVIAVSVFTHLKNQLDELWIDFGTEKNKQLVSPFLTLGSQELSGFLFHAFTGRIKCHICHKFRRVRLGRFGFYLMMRLQCLQD